MKRRLSNAGGALDAIGRRAKPQHVCPAPHPTSSAGKWISTFSGAGEGIGDRDAARQWRTFWGAERQRCDAVIWGNPRSKFDETASLRRGVSTAKESGARRSVVLGTGLDAHRERCG